MTIYPLHYKIMLHFSDRRDGRASAARAGPEGREALGGGLLGQDGRQAQHEVQCE